MPMWPQKIEKCIRQSYQSTILQNYHTEEERWQQWTSVICWSPVGWFIWVCLDQPASRSTAVLPESKPRACQPSVLFRKKITEFQWKQGILFLKKPKTPSRPHKRYHVPILGVKSRDRLRRHLEVLLSLPWTLGDRPWKICIVSHSYSTVGKKRKHEVFENKI